MKKTHVFVCYVLFSLGKKYNMAFIRLGCKAGNTILTWRHAVMLRTLKINGNEAIFTEVMGYGA